MLSNYYIIKQLHNLIESFFAQNLTFFNKQF